MSEFKGTKGKWSIKNHLEEQKWFNIQDEHSEIIARTFYGDSPPPISTEEAHANAQLIAHAPEMLEMLKECYEFTKKVQAPATASLFLGNAIKQLIQKATSCETK